MMSATRAAADLRNPACHPPLKRPSLPLITLNYWGHMHTCMLFVSALNAATLRPARASSRASASSGALPLVTTADKNSDRSWRTGLEEGA